MGHYASECPERNPKDSSGWSSGGFAMMCFEDNDSPVEGDSDQTSAHHTEQLHSEEKISEVLSEVHSEEKSGKQPHLEGKNPEVHLEEKSREQPHSEEKNLEVHLEEKSREHHVSEEQMEQSLSQVHHVILQDWLNMESESHLTDYQSHMNEDLSNCHEQNKR